MSVNVLCPNGRRVPVKITPNTSILQIIEDACKKQNFNPDLYNIKHLRRVLDTSSTVRFANLPNNSQLELVESSTPRVASNVSVNIATESGDRLSHDFPSSSNLLEILQHFNDSESARNIQLLPKDGFEVTLVYSMQKITGNTLASTTLKSLGLTKGKCLFRHNITSASNAPPAQPAAMVSPPRISPSSGAIPKGSRQPLPQSNNPPDIGQPISNQPDLTLQRPKSPNVPVPDSTHPEALPLQRPEIIADADQPIHLPQQGGGLPDLGIVNVQLEPPNIEGNVPVPERPSEIPDEGPDIVSSSNSCNIPDIVQSQNHIERPDIVGDFGNSPMDLVAGHQNMDEEANNPTQSVELMDVDSSASAEVEASSSLSTQNNVVYIGDNDAVLFSLNDATSFSTSDEDDSFFELSVNEVKRMYGEYRKLLKELEDQPLRTKNMREMEKQSKLLTVLNQYPVTQLRICFPDNYVIQASFKPHDTIRSVKEFLRQFLINRELDFNLCGNYPRKTLDPDQSLMEVDCCPKARIYFSTNESLPVYLNDETLQKKSTFNSANSTIIKSNRPKSSHITQKPAPKGYKLSDSTSNSNLNKNAPIRSRQEGAMNKPKWFKLGK